LADVRQNQDQAKKYRQLWREKAVFSSGLIFPQNLDFLRRSVLECGYERESDWKSRMETLLPYTMVTYGGLMSLVAMVQHVLRENIPGDLVETGTWRGGAAGMMALAALSTSGPVRRMHLFDSFQGIPEPDRAHDPIDWIVNDMKLPEAEALGRLRGIKALEAPRKDLERVLFEICSYPKEKITIHEGWFQETVPPASRDIESIAVLRLDGDLYASTKVCLDHLYEKLSPGGFLIIDDWCLTGARKAVQEFFANKKPRPFACMVDVTVRYFIKP
jgi:hypothetical protein